MNRSMPVFTSAMLVLGLSTGRAEKPATSPLKDPIEIRVLGAYEGSYAPGARPVKGLHFEGEITVKVAALKQPIVLVLTSYEPVCWKLDAHKGAIARVIASGYYKQRVEGLDEKVELTSLSHEAGDKGYFFAHAKEAPPTASQRARDETKRHYDRLLMRVKEITGSKVSDFQGKYKAEHFEVK